MKKRYVMFICLFLIACLYGASLAVMAGKGGGGGGKPPRDEPAADPEIAFVSVGRGGKISVMNADGSRQTSICAWDDGALIGTLSWSPDGASIAFGLGNALWRIDVNVINDVPQGSNAQQLVDKMNGFEWSPDGDVIAYSGYTYSPSLDKTEPRLLQTVSADGGIPTTLYTAPEGIWLSGITWRSDAGKIAFKYWDTVNGLYYLKIFTLSDSSVTTVYDSFTTGLDWSKTGDELVFFAQKDGVKGLYTLDLTETDPTPVLLLNDNGARFPSWSPDDSKIVYHHSDWKRNKVYVYVYDIATEETTLLASNGARPDWSRT
jgi:Tol biopolymer transport system component